MIRSCDSQKYTIVIDHLDTGTSHGKILSLVTPESEVLECGCSTGYMTRWMQEKLHCKVSVVEIDEACFQQARSFAVDGYCGDLTEEGWFEYFKEKRFDCILCADVLEHLAAPVPVVKKLSQLLKEDGKVIISIPNIAHNDILLKLAADRFDYTSTGLLDDSHVHFWGYHNLETFCQEAGLSIVEIDGHMNPTGTTEQFAGQTVAADPVLLHHLLRRPLGEVYQYVLVAQKDSFVRAHQISCVNLLPGIHAPSTQIDSSNELVPVVSTVFYSDGDAFSQNNSDRFCHALVSDLTEALHVSFTLPEKCRKVRFDPCEDHFCMIQDLKAFCRETPIFWEINNGIYVDGFFLFATHDPQIIFGIPEGCPPGEVTIHYVMRVFRRDQEPFIRKVWHGLIESPADVITCTVCFEENGSDSGQTFCTQIRRSQDSRFVFHSDIRVPENCTGIRINPCEGYCCTASDIRLIYNGKKLDYSVSDGIVIDGICFFTSEDPQLNIVFPPGGGKTLHADLTVRLFDARDLLLETVKKKIEEDGSAIRALRQAQKEYQDHCDEINSEHKKDLLLQRADFEKQVEQTKTLQSTVVQKDQYIGELVTLCNDRLSLIESLTSQVSSLRSENQQLSDRCAYAEKSFAIISNAFFWKISKPIRWALDRIKDVAETRKEKTNPFRACHFDYEKDHDFSSYHTDIKTIAIYLPQFHSFPENNQWWGKGFTEWTNVKKGKPLFDEHYQPRVPDKGIGYYNLSKVSTLKKQVKLAKKHGIYGFGIYYYWFSGKQLMKKPMENLLAHTEIDIPFFLIWANENWTRTWDGSENDILIKQEYLENDPKQFICDIKKYTDDKRYIRVDGKPVIALYSPKSVPNLRHVLQVWRDAARACGIGEILIWTCISDASAADLMISDVIDGEYEFPPRGKGFVASTEKPGQGISYDYEELVEAERHFNLSYPGFGVFRGSMIDWDNSARKSCHYNCWHNFSLDYFYLWNRINVGYTRRTFPPDKRFVFINAWNEWGEGTYLEPDRNRGYAVLNTLSRALFDLPYEMKNRWMASDMAEPIHLVGCGVPEYENPAWKKQLSKKTMIAVQAHVYYTDLLDDIIERINQIRFPYDLYISTDTPQKKAEIQRMLAGRTNAKAVKVRVFPNKGRDVAPFILQLQPVIHQYEYFCHIHSKKSLQGDIGTIWRHYLYENLLGSTGIIDEILYAFETQKKLGLIFPQNLDLLATHLDWGCNRKIAQDLVNRMKMKIDLPDSESLKFIAGNMLWGRVKAVSQLFDCHLQPEDFPEELGQLDGTIMHAIERLWLILAKENGYDYLITRSLFDDRPLI